MSPYNAERLFAALVAAEVHFIVIGGFAVSAHGYLRGTKDLDIVPNLVEMKQAAGRLEDELDLKRLRAVRGE